MKRIAIAVFADGGILASRSDALSDSQDFVSTR
jgi:hypothetical protein